MFKPVGARQQHHRMRNRFRQGRIPRGTFHALGNMQARQRTFAGHILRGPLVQGLAEDRPGPTFMPVSKNSFLIPSDPP